LTDDTKCPPLPSLAQPSKGALPLHDLGSRNNRMHSMKLPLEVEKEEEFKIATQGKSRKICANPLATGELQTPPFNL